MRSSTFLCFLPAVFMGCDSKNNTNPTSDFITPGAASGTGDTDTGIETTGPREPANVYDLSSANAKITPAFGSDDIEHACGAGDVDGDGIDDLFIGAYYSPWFDGPAASLISGPISGELSLTDADAKIFPNPPSSAGPGIGCPGDVNNDGFNDLLVGMTGNLSGPDDPPGEVFLILGPVSGEFSLENADAWMIGAIAGAHAGDNVEGAGDVNGDGHTDILIGEAGPGELGDIVEARSYLVLGPVRGDIDLAESDMIFTSPVRSNEYGNSLASAGDVNGDGLDDILLGRPQAYDEDLGSTFGGAAYLLLGPTTGDLTPTDADATLLGEDIGGRASHSMSGVGDINGDGLDDVLIGGSVVDANGKTGSGAAYLVLGGFSGEFMLSNSDAIFTGERGGDSAGSSVDSAGDIDGDGHNDLIIGAYKEGTTGHRAGAAYLIYGPVIGSMDLGYADLKFLAEASEDQAGNHVAGVGDIDDDGFPDIVVVAQDESSVNLLGGAAYLLSSTLF